MAHRAGTVVERIEIDSVGAATIALRTLILERQLTPGEQIRQEELAERLGVSRSPIREALNALRSEGLVRHRRNQGYFVARLSRDELSQVYLMRRLLETEVLQSVRRPTGVDIENLRAKNAGIRDAAEKEHLGEMLAQNRAFHFAIFELSPLGTVRREIERLWHISEPYRAAYLWHPETRGRILRDHEAIIAALRSNNRSRLVALADRHRDAALIDVLAQLTI